MMLITENLNRNNFEGKSNWFEAMGNKKFNEFIVAYYISRSQQRSVDEHEDESGGGSGANYQKGKCLQLDHLGGCCNYTVSIFPYFMGLVVFL